MAVNMEALSEEWLDPFFHQSLIDAAVGNAAAALPDRTTLLHGVDRNLGLPPWKHIEETVAKLPRTDFGIRSADRR